MAEYPDYDPKDVVRTPSQEGHLNVAKDVDDEATKRAAYVDGVIDKDLKVDELLSDYAPAGFATPSDLPKVVLPATPTTAGDYTINCTVADGVATLSWVAVPVEE